MGRKEREYEEIEQMAISLLLKQGLTGIFGLSLFDMKRVNLGGEAVIGKLSTFEKRTGDKLSFRPEGCTIKYNGVTMIMYDDLIDNAKRVNWSIAHEVGHLILCHSGGKSKFESAVEEAEANLFAAEFLMPEPVVRYLDSVAGRRINPDEMIRYFNVSFAACRRRRTELDCRDEFMSEGGDLLINQLFPEEITEGLIWFDEN